MLDIIELFVMDPDMGLPLGKGSPCVVRGERAVLRPQENAFVPNDPPAVIFEAQLL